MVDEPPCYHADSVVLPAVPLVLGDVFDRAHDLSPANRIGSAVALIVKEDYALSLVSMNPWRFIAKVLELQGS